MRAFTAFTWTIILLLCSIEAGALHTGRRHCTMKVAHCVFGMGCFWEPQKQFDSKNGVVSTLVGYSGGTNKNPTYESVCGGDGHIEAVRVEYDDSIISYNDLLDVFWDQDLSVMARQSGQYASRIWVTDKQQMQEANKRIDLLRGQSDPRSEIPVVAYQDDFFIAEGYHQKYWSKQLPRFFFLAIAVGLNCAPGLDPSIYKLSAVLTSSFVVFSIWERFVDRSVRKL